MLHIPPFLSQRALLRALLLATPMLGLLACQPENDSHAGKMADRPAPEVAVVTVQTRTVPVKLEYNAQITGVRDTEVRARVTGILLKRNYVEGARVVAGQSLFSIDPAPFQAALARADADLARAAAQQAKAERDAARLKPLIEAHAISQKDYDDAASAVQIAAAEVKSLQTRVTDARLNLSYTHVAAPISGIAGRIQVTEGSLISGPDVLLTTVTQMDPIYVSFGISDNDRLKLNSAAAAGRLQLPKGGRFDVALKLADGSDYEQLGKLDFSGIRVNATTGTSEARAELPNKKGMLRPGQFVRAILQGATRVDAIMVPQRAVLEGPSGKFVFVVGADSKAEIRPVEVGEWSEESWVINKGLQAGDRVIVDGVVRIGPGVLVKATEAGASDMSADTGKATP